MAMTRRDAMKAAGLGLGAMASRMPLAGMARTARQPDILLITSEDNGCELSCYGDPYARTPHLDKLAAEGVRFDNAYITQSVCSPSRSSIFTGLYPHQNGQIGLATHAFAMFEKYPNLPSLLKQAGYRTGIIGKLHVNPESAFPFDLKTNPGSFSRRDGRKFAAAAETFIKASDRPFFLMVNFPDAHLPFIKQQFGLPEAPLTADDVKCMPYLGVDTPRLRATVANYYNCMLRLDAHVGMLLKVLAESGRAADTLVIYLGDHGAQVARGKVTCYEVGVKVPLLLRWPGRIKGAQQRRELISSVDILPTALEAAGAAAPKGLAGRSLLPLAGGKDGKWRTYLFTERNVDSAWWHYPQRTVRDERYKLILNLLQDRGHPAYRGYRTKWSGGMPTDEALAAAPPRVQRAYKTWKNPPPIELYDLKTDPWEFENLAGKPELAEVRQRLLAALETWRAETNDPLTDPGKLKMLTEEMDAHGDKKPGRNHKWKYLEYLHPARASETPPDDLPRPIRVFVAGAEDIEGVDNAAGKYPQYREQNVVVTNDGKVVLLCQGRNKSNWSDRSGQDLVVKVSADSGRTWSRGRLVATHGLKSICPNAAVYDRDTNVIHVLYNLFTWDYTKVPKGIRGEAGDLNCRQYVVTSADGGGSWSQPRDISAMVDTHGAVMVVGSGEGIQLRHGPHKGRLIVAGGDFYKGKKVLCFYSDDGGKTWQRGKVVPHSGRMAWASESKVAEMPDGTLVLNSRTFVSDASKTRLRTRAFSADGGVTWTKLANDPALETVSCNGGLISVRDPKTGKTVLLCSVPVGPKRTHGTVYVSFDGGKTWPVKKLVVPGAFAYSSLLALPDGKIGLFYEGEGYREIRLVRFSLDWLMEKGE